MRGQGQQGKCCRKSELTVFDPYCDHSNWRTFLNVGKLFWS